MWSGQRVKREERNVERDVVRGGSVDGMEERREEVSEKDDVMSGFDREGRCPRWTCIYVIQLFSFLLGWRVS